MHAGGKGGTERLNLLVNFIGNRKCIAVRLAIDAEQYRGFSVRGDDGVNRSSGTRHSSDIAHANGNSGRGSFDDDLAQFVGRLNPSADQAEHELMIIFEKPRRI